MKVWKESINKTAYQEELAYIVSVLRENLDLFVGSYPHVSVKNRYSPEENVLWTSSFFVGMCYLAYEYTGDEVFRKYEKEHLDSFQDRLDRKRGISHDLGFLYTLSCVACHKTTGDRRAEELARRAARLLAGRYNEKGKYIQAWGEMGIGYPDVKIIIDTMLNLPLLYWTGDEKLAEIAENHALTASGTLVRPDASTYHTYLMNPDTG